MKKLFALLICFALQHETQAQNVINHKGQDIFISGINLAWMQFAHDLEGFNEANFTSAIKNIKNAGGNATRWWIHITGEETPKWKGDSVSGISQLAVSNFVRAMDIAAEEGIVVSVCLWSFDMLKNTERTETVINRNALLLNDSAHTQYYIDNALTPLVQATKRHPAILCWEIFNEPEGMTSSPGDNWAGITKVPMSNIQRVINQCAGAIHRIDSSAKVSSGCWNSKAISYNKSIDSKAHNYYADSNLIKAGGDTLGFLDFYQLHYYADWYGTSYSPFHNHASYFELDKPLIIGEFAARGLSKKDNEHFTLKSDEEMTPDQCYRWLMENGYAGGLSWTYTNHDGFGGLPDIKNAMLYLQENYPDRINIKKDPSYNYRPYVIKNLKDTSILVGSASIITNFMNLNNYFGDNESPLNYSAQSYGATTATIHESMLSLALADTAGYAKIQITATDHKGKSVSNSFYVFIATTSSENKAYKKPVYPSSVENDKYEIFYINDQNASTRWSSEYSDDQSFVIDMMQEESISRAVLKWEYAYGKAWNIQTSADIQNWTTVYQTHNSDGEIDNIVFDAITARYVKFQGIERYGSWGYSLYEIELYENNRQAENSAPASKNAQLKYTCDPLIPFEKKINTDVITDADNDLLEYSIEMKDGSQLPDWLLFESGSTTLSGTAPLEMEGDSIVLSLIATDYFNLYAKNNITLHIEPASTQVGITHIKKTIISPNPATNTIRIQHADNTPIAHISVINSHGIEIDRFIEKNNQNSFTISHLAKGIYTIVIKTNNSVSTQKLIVE